MFDTDIGRYINQVENYAQRIILWSTCNSGGVLDDIQADSATVALAAVQYSQNLGMWFDTLYGTAADRISMPAFTAFVSHALNGHDTRGAPYIGDLNSNGWVSVSELKHLVDSLYHTATYSDGSFGYERTCPPPDTDYFDTVQVLDIGGISANAGFGENGGVPSMRFAYGGVEVARITAGSQFLLKGATPNDTLAGLRIGPAFAIHTDGDFVAGDSLLANRGIWLDTADLSGSLIVRNNCGTVVYQASQTDTTKIRGWAVQRFMGMQ
jgi:hypothetical protein